MIYADPVIMYQVYCPRCDCQLILYREDLDQPVQCEACLMEFDVSLPGEEVGEEIYART